VLKYADLSQIADWALGSVGTMTKKGYVTGRPGNLFAPKANLSRAEAVKMIDNVMGELINSMGTYTRVVPGNMVVSSPGVTLKDTYISGDLYLTEGIGSEQIQLIDVEIKGRTIVADGVDVKSLLTGKHIAEGNTQGQPTPKPTNVPGPTTPTATPGSSTPSTPDPTTQPTTAPTPTQSPTATPTPSPTQGPTATPTPSPTQSPTTSPTPTPTQGPTPTPTQDPTAPTPTPHESTTYYIDYENGDDANDGLTKSTAWKRHPFMQNYSGKYVHSQGDVFVFKGGTVWPSECFSLIIKTGGTQSNPDRYTVDKSWYSGTEWTRPIFDMERQVLQENPRPVYFTKAENVVFEGFEVKNQRIYGTNAWSWGGITVTDTSNVTVRDCYIHDWYIAEPTVTPDQDFGGVYIAYSPGAILENCVIHGSVVPGIGGYSGVGIRNNGYTTRGCEVYDVTNGFLGCGTLDGNEIHHIYTSYDSGDNVLTPPNGTHANGVYLFGNAVFCNNYIHDILAPGAPVVFPAAGWNKANGTMLIYNNIIQGGLHLNADGMAEGNNATYHIYNNIIQANNSCILASKKNNNPIKNVYIKNNILITTGTYPNPVSFAQDIDNLDVDRNIYYNHKKTNLVDKKDCVLNFMNKRYNMDTSREAGFNLTSILSENPLTIDFIPSSWSDIAVDSGVDLSSFFTDDRLGESRPQGNGFDIGPYEFTGDVK
jgi:hypothetical protein